MRAMFLKRNYIEKSKRSGRSMVVLDVFELPRLKEDGSGELTQGQARNYFIMDEECFDIGKGCKLGDIVDVAFRLDERFNRGVPVSMTKVQDSPYDLAALAK